MTDLLELKKKGYLEFLQGRNPAMVEMIRGKLAEGKSPTDIAGELPQVNSYQALRTAIQSAAEYIRDHAEA